MRIVIAEDNAILAEGLAQLLIERGHEVPAVVGDAPGLADAVDAHRPDAAVADIRMPPRFTDEGLVEAIALRRRFPDAGVLVFSQWVETRYATELLAGRAAGVGYLLEDRVADVAEFVAALERVAAGGTALDPEVGTQLMGSSRRTDRLTPREREVLAPMAQGWSNSALATSLGVTERAVEKHVGNIFTKLDLPPSEGHHRRVLAGLRYLG